MTSSRLRVHFVAMICFLAGAFAQAQENPEIGAALQAIKVGRSVTFNLYVENLGDVGLDTLNADFDLDAVFGAGNYTITDAPNIFDAAGDVVVNGAYNGTDTLNLFGGGTIPVGEVVAINLGVSVDTPADLGSGLGVYSAQITVSGDSPLDAMVTDLSDQGTNPDPDGNGAADDAGEDDPTSIILSESVVAGIALDVSLNGNQVTFTYYLENFSNVTLVDLDVADDLDALFGAGNYSILSAPSLIDDPGGVTLNAGFDGSADTELITSGSLIAGDTLSFDILVDVTTMINGGVYSHQVSFTGTSSTDASYTDQSDAGSEPDANGDNDPADTGENDPTQFVLGEEPQIGLAHTVAVNNSNATFIFFLENLGNVALEDLVLNLDLDAIFGAGNYEFTTPILVDDPGGITLNANFDGDEDTSLIDTSALAIADTASIQLTVTIRALSDNQGLGFGNYRSQTSVTAVTANGGATGDTSDDGSDPDPNGNGNPDEAGENDPTDFTVAEVPVIGAAQVVSVQGATAATYNVNGANGFNLATKIVHRITIQNFGNTTLTDLNLPVDLIAVYGNGNFGTTVITGNPGLLTDPGTINLNSSFNGSTNTALLSAGSTLEPGGLAEIQFELGLITPSDQGSGLGVYSSQVTVSGDSDVGAVTVNDLSDAGTNPDPNDNGDPTDVDEDDPNAIVLGRAGIALNAGVTGNQVTFDYYLESFSPLETTNISLLHSMESIFGAGNFTITTPPAFIDDPGTLTLNPGYDGSTDDALFSAGGTLAAGDTAQVQMAVTVNAITNRGSGLGVYSTQVILDGSLGNATVFDNSVNGTNPDPDDDDDPSGFVDASATPINMAPLGYAGLAIDASQGSTTVVLDLYLEAFGSEPSLDLSLPLDLDSVFGAGNWTMAVAPAFVDDPGTVTISGSFDGSGDTELIAPGSSLTHMDTAQIQLTVSVDTLSNPTGLGVGAYQLSTTLTSNDSGGVVFTDVSDNGTDPDITGNNDPSDSNAEFPNIHEADTTPINTQLSHLGIALQTRALGATQIQMDVYVENLSNLEITDVAATFSPNTFSTLFGGSLFAPNASVVQMPTHVSGPVLSYNTFLNGSTSLNLSFSGDLQPGEVTHFNLILNVDTVADVGNGVGVYDIPLLVTGNDSLGNALVDSSDSGTDPDPNGNGDPTEAGEDDASRVILGEEVIPGVALDVAVAGTQVTFDFYLENFGGNQIDSVSLPFDLDAIFGAGNYTISSGPTPTGISANGGYDGSGDTELIDTGQSLAMAGTATLQLVVDVDTIADVGQGLGNYSAQATVSAIRNTSNGSDISDDGTDPDPNGDSNPSGAGESDASDFNVTQSEMGAALDVTVNGDEVTFDFYIENLGNATNSGFDFDFNLDDIFGAGNYTIVSGPAYFTVTRLLLINDSYDGSSDTTVLEGGEQATGIKEQIRLVVNVDTLIDPGAGLGDYSAQFTVTANGGLSDISDDGTEPDTNGDSFPDGAGEDDASDFTVAERPVPGLALSTSVDNRQVTLTYTMETFGNVEPQTVAITQDLDAVFGAGNYSINAAPAFTTDPGTVTLNAGFNGSGDTALLSGGSTLARGSILAFTVVVDVDTPSDQGSGIGIYSIQGTATSTSPDATLDTDTSDDGTEPDTDGDSVPDESGENDASDIELEAQLGDFVWNDLDGDGVQDGGEPGIQNVIVFLDTNANGTVDIGESTDTTDASGAYSFGNLAPGTYTVAVDDTTVTTGFVLTGGTDPVSVTLDNGEIDNTADFGYQQQDATIGDFVWHDRNGDGVQDGGEEGISGVTVFIDENENGTLDGGEVSDVTDGSGAYDFTDLPLGTYTIELDDSTFPTDYVLVTTAPLTPTIAAGEDYNDADFGLQLQDATIGDFVWNDLNGDDVQDGGEAGISGVTVYIDSNANGSLDGGETSDTTDGSGAYDFTNLAPGTYTIAVDATTIPVGFAMISTEPQSVTIALSEDYNDADFGLQQQDATIGDFVWNDLDGDGVQDGGEPGLDGYTVFIDSNDNGTLDGGEPSTVTAGGGAYDFTDLPTGTYVIRVDAATVTAGFVGITSASVSVNLAAGEDYNDADFGFQQQDASIGDFVWDDVDGDGVQDGGEPGLSGLTVFLDLNSNGTLDGGEPSAVTDASGAYDFTNLATGTYSVRVDETTLPLPEWILTGGTNPHAVNLAAGEDYNDADFGYQLQNATIGDFVWDDQNGDGVQDGGEPGLSGITVYLDLNSNGALDGGEPSAATDASGAYDFANLATGTYSVRVDETTLPLPEWILTGGTNPHAVNLGTSEDYNDADFGYQLQNASIGDLVYDDLNGNGAFDAGEPGLSGVTVFLDANANGTLDGGEQSDTTDGAGAYDLTNLAPGSYTVAIDPTSVPTGFVIISTNPMAVTITTSENNTTTDFGLQQQDATIGDFVWNDLNGDGVQDGGEPGLSGYTVYLDLNANDAFDVGEPSDVTDASGAYDIENLATGTYNVRVDEASVTTGFVQITNATVNVNLGIGEDYNDADFGYQQQDASIGDFVWNDVNGDGVQDAGEPGLAGYVVYIDANANDSLDAGETSATTDANGAYDFTDLPTGTYRITIDVNSVPAASIRITDAVINVNLAAGEDYNDADFGYQQQDATIGDFVWDDQNGDGVQDKSEPGLAGILVYLDLNDNGAFDAGEPSSTTDANGAYDITELATGTYNVRVDETTLPLPEWVLTGGTNPAVVNLGTSEDYNDADFGYQLQNATIGDLVFDDRNRDGVAGTLEPRLAGVRLFLDLNTNGAFDAGEPEQTSAADGTYLFTNLAPGTYVVDVDDATVPADYVLTTDNDPLTVTVVTSENYGTADFGYQRRSSLISGLVWIDLNGDATFDAGEPTPAGVTVAITRALIGPGGRYRPVGDPEIVTTAADGTYILEDLSIGYYIVQVTDDADILGEASLTTDQPIYFVELDQDEAETGKDFGYCDAPRITAQPEGGVFCVGDDITISVTAEGSGDLEYQWYKDGFILTGDTTDTLVLRNAVDDMEGTYHVTVTGGCGEVTSAEAVFEIKTLRAELPSSLAQGINNLVVEASLTCDTASLNWSWENLNTGAIFGENQNPVTLPEQLFENTAIRLTVIHDSGLEETADMLVLVADKSAVLDPNADGCNTIEDLWYQADYWLERELMFDANNDGVVDMLDMLYVNTTNPCPED